jgi:hypothetical protein
MPEGERRQLEIQKPFPSSLPGKDQAASGTLQPGHCVHPETARKLPAGFDLYRFSVLQELAITILSLVSAQENQSFCKDGWMHRDDPAP